MAIIVNTRYPEELVNQIKRKIDIQEVDTWVYDTDGDFTSSALLWKNHAWFRTYIEDDCLEFAILGRKDSLLTLKEYGFYHGKLVEMLITFFSRFLLK